MGRDLTRRRHGRHRGFDRVRRGKDTLGFLGEHHDRLDTVEGPRGVHDAMHLVQGEDEHFTHERIIEADTSDLIGLSSEHAQSIDFDGAGEYMGSGTFNLIGIANTWTIAGWFKFNDVDNGSGTLLNIQDVTGLENAIRIFQRDVASFGPLGIQLSVTDSAGNFVQNVGWPNMLGPAGVWQYIAIQWDGTVVNRKLFLNGVDQGLPGFSPINNPGTQIDAPREVAVGRAAFAVPSHDGRIASLAIWDNLLAPAEILATYNGGSIFFDLNEDEGNYVSSGNLKRWWEIGKVPSPELGKDSGPAVPSIDIEAGAVGITDADRVFDVPQ